MKYRSTQLYVKNYFSRFQVLALSFIMKWCHMNPRSVKNVSELLITFSAYCITLFPFSIQACTYIMLEPQNEVLYVLSNTCRTRYNGKNIIITSRDFYIHKAACFHCLKTWHPPPFLARHIKRKWQKQNCNYGLNNWRHFGMEIVLWMSQTINRCWASCILY